MTRIVALAALLLALSATGAAAEPLTGVSDDPADGAGSLARDIEQVRSSVDPGTSTWSLTLRMRAPVSTAESVRIHGILYQEDPARPGVCPSDDTTGELGRLEGDTDPARDDQSFGQVRASKVTSADRREVTLSVTTPQLAGAAAICAFVSVSHGKPYDVLDSPVILRAGIKPLHDAAPAAPEVKLAGHVIRRRALLQPFDAATTLRLRVTRRGGGATLARGAATVGAGRGAAVRMRLTRRGRRMLARHRSVRARLFVTASQSGRPRANRRFTVTLARS